MKIIRHNGKAIRAILCLATAVLFSCSDNDKNTDYELPPESKVKFTGFSPASGDVGDLVTISGEGFGTDRERIEVQLGYRDAVIESITDGTIQFRVPDRITLSNDIVVKIEDEGIYYTFEEKFRYVVPGQTIIRVSTVAEIPRPADTGNYPCTMIYDGEGGFYIGYFYQGHDSQNKFYKDGEWTDLSDALFNEKSGFAISPDKNTLYQTTVVGEDESATKASLYISYRNDGFKTEHPYVFGRGFVCGLAVHPVDGTAYCYDRNWGDPGIYRISPEDNYGSIEKIFVPNTIMNGSLADSEYRNYLMNLRFSSTGDKLYVIPLEGGDPKPSSIWTIDYDASAKTLLPETQTLFAGSNFASGYLDGERTQARFAEANDIAGDKEGNLYVSDRTNHCIRKITPEGMVSTYCGVAGSHGMQDGEGDEVRFDLPRNIFVDESGGNLVLYVLDQANCRIRKIEETTGE